jgi:hypothetical protein
MLDYTSGTFFFFLLPDIKKNKVNCLKSSFCLLIHVCWVTTAHVFGPNPNILPSEDRRE